MSEEKKAGCGSCLSTLGSLAVVVVLGFMFTSNGGLFLRLGNSVFTFGKPTFDGKPMGTLVEAETLEANKKVAEAAVKTFHGQLLQGKCDEIYDQASDVLKSYQSKESLSILCSQWKQFGELKSSEIGDWWGKPTEDAKARQILVRYSTVTQNVSMQETFVWLIQDDKAALVNYQAQPNSAVAKQLPPTPSSGENESKP